jgi:hypothetical protein
VPLHETADRDDCLTDAVGLVTASFHDGIDRLALGGVDEATGIDDDDLGFIEVGRRLGAAGDQLGQISLAVDGVLVAAEGKEADLHSSGVPVSIPTKLAADWIKGSEPLIRSPDYKSVKSSSTQ